MDATAVPPALAERLGPEAASGLVDLFNAAGEECVQHAATQAVDRFERRLTEEFSKLRVEMVQGDTAVREELAALRSDLRQETASQKFDLLKWSFLFWIGQVVAVTGIIATLLRMSGR